MSTDNSTCYLVRTLQKFVERSIVAVGWSDFDFSAAENAEAAIFAINGKYGVGRRGNQIRRFFAINEGDYIVAPLPYSVAIGRAKGPMFYDPDSHSDDRSNQRRVEFHYDENGQLLTIPRDAFSEAFQRRLRVQGMTVNDLSEFSTEIIANYVALSHGDTREWAHQLDAHKSEAEKSFKQRLISNIQSGKTGLRTGGLGLEHLIQELLVAEGYDAQVLGKRSFPGMADADIKASRVDPCLTTNLLVQVKHHQGYSNEHGLKQLEEIRGSLPQYDDYNLVFCTTARVSDQFRKHAEGSAITVLDGDALVDWIHDRIDGLSERTKASLGIYEVPGVYDQ